MASKDSTKYWSKKAMNYLALATKGDCVAQYELGLRCLKGEEVPENHKLAIEWLVKSSNQGYEDAQYLLGTCYQSGTGVEQNEKIALGFFIQSAEAANKYAQHAVGEYFFGEKRYNEAVNWYKRSARQEYAPAQVELARCYYYGFGSIKSESMALEWVEKAVGKNYKPADYLLKEIERGQ